MKNKIKAQILILCLVILMPVMSWADVGPNWIEQWGITWTFDKNLSTDGAGDTYQYGRFANGDYWVVGPVNIIGIDPPSMVIRETRINDDGSTEIYDRTINGSMINPSVNYKQGYDSNAALWDAEYNVGDGISAGSPLEVPKGSSLISTISLPARDYGSWLESAAILTVLESVPDENSFRPPYYSIDKTINYNERMLDYGKLKSLSSQGIEFIPLLAQQSDYEDQDASVERMFQRPWIDHVKNWMARNIHPIKNMKPYGREISTQVGIGALVLHLDYTNEQKRNLLVRYVQLGIDLYGIISAGAIDNWPGGGGHCQGRKWPILFAGLVLDDAGMKSIGDKSGDYLYSEKLTGGNYGPRDPPPDYILFQEDLQTWYVTEDDVGRPIRAMTCKGYATSSTPNTIGVILPIEGNYASLEDTYIEITSGPGVGQRRYITESSVPRTGGEGGILTVSEPWDTVPVTNESYYEVQGYEEFHIGLPEWGINHLSTPDKDNPSWHAEYRTLNGYCWSGWILATYIMDAKGLWNHDVMFEYQDRHVQISAPDGKFPGWHFQDKFTKSMWYTYRDDYGAVWTTKPEPDPEPKPEPEPKADAEITIPDQTLLRISNNIIKSGGNSAVTINCDVKEAGTLTVKIYDSKGREIITLWNKHEEPGTVPITWLGEDNSNNAVGSGIYIVHMNVGDYSETKKIAVIK